MNWVVGILEAMREHPTRAALWTPAGGTVTFGELHALAARAQRVLREAGVQRGDHVLLLDLPGPRLYAAVIGMLAMGAGVVFVEPWMAPSKIDHVLRLVAPKVFLAPRLGQAWGLRVPSIRAIPGWVSPQRFVTENNAPELVVEDMEPDAHAVVTFSSGTTGQPKGVVRSHGYLCTIDEMVRGHDTVEDPKPDLAVFPNVVLYHLSRARCSLLVPTRWSEKVLATMGHLPAELQPESVTCGPAFLRRLTKAPGFDKLKFIGVGGALTDCADFEAAFARFPGVLFGHIYGGTEVEPVAHVDGHEAVRRSRERGLFQALHIGKPIPELRTENTPDGLWVSGFNVCPEYLGADLENKLYKRRDEEGRLWHFMGDRVTVDDDGWWYGGRAFQRPEDFRDEQRIYSLLQSSASFLHRTERGHRVLVGEGLAGREAEVYRAFPDLAAIVEGKIARDVRHRSRIDRKKSLAKVARRVARVDA